MPTMPTISSSSPHASRSGVEQGTVPWFTLQVFGTGAVKVTSAFSIVTVMEPAFRMVLHFTVTEILLALPFRA